MSYFGSGAEWVPLHKYMHALAMVAAAAASRARNGGIHYAKTYVCAPDEDQLGSRHGERTSRRTRRIRLAEESDRANRASHVHYGISTLRNRQGTRSPSHPVNRGSGMRELQILDRELQSATNATLLRKDVSLYQRSLLAEATPLLREAELVAKRKRLGIVTILIIVRG